MNAVQRERLLKRLCPHCAAPLLKGYAWRGGSVAGAYWCSSCSFCIPAHWMPWHETEALQ